MENVQIVLSVEFSDFPRKKKQKATSYNEVIDFFFTFYDFFSSHFWLKHIVLLKYFFYTYRFILSDFFKLIDSTEKFNLAYDIFSNATIYFQSPN